MSIFDNPINAGLSTDPVTNGGYSESDLNSYYGGTYLLCEDEEGRMVVCFCRRFDSRTVATCEVWTPSGVQMLPVRIEKLYRFLLPVGFYFSREGEPFRYSYVQNRSYKKGLNPEFIKLMTLNHGRVTMKLTVLMQALYPMNAVSESDYLISRRCLVYRGKVYTAYKCLTVGDEKSGEIITPFECIKQRLTQENRNAF